MEIIAGVDEAGRGPLAGPLVATFRAFFQIPQSASRKKQRAMLAGTIRPKKKDWDNLGKSPSDALNGLAYVDDRQIADGRVVKFYSDRPRLEIEISEIGE